MAEHIPRQKMAPKPLSDAIIEALLPRSLFAQSEAKRIPREKFVATYEARLPKTSIICLKTMQRTNSGWRLHAAALPATDCRRAADPHALNAGASGRREPSRPQARGGGGPAG